jgi:DNA-binding CsgD family transcriptional regulator/ketosteroid isomerase-like protein
MVAEQTKVVLMPDTLYNADDREAIATLIHKETSCFRNLDFDGWAACYLQSPRTCTVSAAPGIGVTVLRGWDAIRDDMASALALGHTPCGMSDFRKHNMQITIDGDIAWAIYDGWTQADDGSEASSIETVILERTGKSWHIVYSAFAQSRMTRTAPDRIGLDAKGHVVWTTPAAAEALRTHPALTLSYGRLRARRGDWDKVLQAAITRAGALHGFFNHHDFVDTTGAPFRMPVVLGEDETGAAMICSLLVMDGLTYLDINPTADFNRRLVAAQMVFGLSPGQMALATRIASGESLTDAAETMRISINTARTHLKRIYDKTGVNSQTALVRLLLSVG